MAALQYEDRDGDVWTRDADGMYATRGLFPRSLANLRAAFGPLRCLGVAVEAPAMTREEALAKAVTIVNRLSPPQATAFVSVSARAASAERLARFLMGETPEADA